MMGRLKQACRSDVIPTSMYHRPVGYDSRLPELGKQWSQNPPPEEEEEEEEEGTLLHISAHALHTSPSASIYISEQINMRNKARAVGWWREGVGHKPKKRRLRYDASLIRSRSPGLQHPQVQETERQKRG